MSTFEKATFVLDNHKCLDDDDKRLCSKCADFECLSYNVSAHDLVALEVLYHEANGMRKYILATRGN